MEIMAVMEMVREVLGVMEDLEMLLEDLEMLLGVVQEMGLEEEEVAERLHPAYLMTDKRGMLSLI